ncbi:hypothetical protein [Streptomyces sp. DH7]|uniref:hypothetical protein n=1 Tax=Streptomyces sp. DH7 TaxID=2857006 RepID=UPI0035AEF92D
MTVPEENRPKTTTTDDTLGAQDEGATVEQDTDRGELFGEQRLIRCVNAVERARAEEGIRAGALWLSQTLKQERGGRTSDDATVLLIEWRGSAADHLTVLE